MATAQLFGELFGNLGKGVHAWASPNLKVAFSNTDLALDTGQTLSDVTEISTAGGYPAGGVSLDSEVWEETAGGSNIWRLVTADEVFTASGADTDAFRYLYLYDDTPTSPADPLIAKLDMGSSQAVTDGNTLTIDVGTNGWVLFGPGTVA